MTKPDLSKITPTRKKGSERFKSGKKSLPFKVKEFWQWASSDLMSNATRGVLAEFIVAKALGIDTVTAVRDEWAVYDLETPDGITIEVKTSAYLQSWGQKRFSTITFSIAPAVGWDGDKGVFSGPPKRHAMVYVFCLFKERCKQRANPLYLEQWDFYVVPTKLLDDECGKARSIGYNALLELAGKAIGWGELQEKVKQAAK